MEDPEKYITGDWKAFTFHLAKERHTTAIVQHLGQHFVSGEPLNGHISGGIFDADREADYTNRVNVWSNDGLSFFLTEKNSKEIVAVNLISDSRKPSPFQDAPPHSWVTRKLGLILLKFRDDAEPAFQSKFKCDYFAEIRMSSVNRNYRGERIAIEMYERSLQFLKAKGYPVIKGVFTHPGTQRIAHKLGFEDVHKIHLKDQVNENEKRIFPEAMETEVNEVVVLAAKWL